MSENDSRTYFACETVDNMLPELQKRSDAYYRYLSESSRMSVYRRSYEAYYKALFRGARLNRSGTEGEYTTMNVNHYRNLIQHLKVMTTQQLPALTPQAANTDYTSLAQCIVATGILDYYINEKGMDGVLEMAVELCLLFAESYVLQEWDPSLGEPFTADTELGKVYKTGDISHVILSPLDINFDFTKPDGYHHTWYIVRKYVNRFDLASRYPDKAEKVLDMRMDNSRMRDQRIGVLTIQETELIPVYHFYHAKTDSVPNGRMTIYASDTCCLFDGPLPYDDLPVYRMAPEEMQGTCWGYTVAYDLLPLQEAYDGLVSTVITNQSQYGVQNIWIPTGAGISVQSLAGGLNLITSDPKYPKPEGLNLTSTPPEIFNFIGQISTMMEVISGVNSTARGNPEQNLKSGAALALVQSMAIQFNSGLQKSYAKMWGRLGTGIIQLLKKFPQTKRNIAIAGKMNRSYIAEFSKEDICNINRVTVDMGNPLSRTVAGKVDMATNLLQQGMISSPEQYIEVLTTGKLEAVYQGPQAEKMLIRAENEKMMDETAVIAIATDQHSLHISEHKTVLASPESREDQNVVDITLAHINDHINLLRTTDPALLMAVGQTPIQIPNPNMPNPGVNASNPNGGSASQPQGSNPPGGGSQNPSGALNPVSPQEQAAAKVGQPNMPKNALTHKPYNPVTGGL